MKQANSKILVIDDDASLRSAVCLLLEKDGYGCICAENGLEGVNLYKCEHPNLVILDMMMPGMDGTEVCQRIRESSRTVPVLFLTARADIDDKRNGFTSGADDYLAKPFSGEELRLRVGALLRRAREYSDDAAHHVAVSGALEIDIVTCDTYLRGLRIELTPKEGRILALLASHPGTIFSKDDIIRSVWGKEYLDSSISISVYIRRIREKIENDPASPRYIETVWSRGYRFRVA